MGKVVTEHPIPRICPRFGSSPQRVTCSAVNGAGIPEQIDGPEPLVKIDRSQPGAPFAQSGRPASGRGARTFMPRRGRMNDVKQKAVVELVPALLVKPEAVFLDQQAIFGRSAPLAVEVGFGMGESTVALAHDHPEWDIIAIDVHTPGFAALAIGLAANGRTNVRIVDADALDVLEWMIAPASVTLLTTFFPDPWPKKDQQHKRLVTESFADLVASRLTPDGIWRMATDWPDYGEQMHQVVANSPSVIPLGDDPFARWPGRPITKFENRGLLAGRPIVDIATIRSPLFG
jgi:tRNA (guanine-N7-)-methyltransferase